MPLEHLFLEWKPKPIPKNSDLNLRGICAKYAYFWISWLCILYKYAYSRTPWLCIFRKYAYSSITWLWILTNMHIAKIMWLWLWISKIVIFIVTQYAYCDIDGRPLDTQETRNTQFGDFWHQYSSPHRCWSFFVSDLSSQIGYSSKLEFVPYIFSILVRNT